MALTVAQIAEHIGRMMTRGVNQTLTNETVMSGARFIDILGDWMRDYRKNSSFGTQADRDEAMRTFRRNIYQQVVGVDPVGTAAAQHHFKNHWLNHYAPGEAAETEA